MMIERTTSSARHTDFVNRRILLVDDDAKMRDGVARVLENSFPGAIVETAGSGKEALASFQQAPADVVISDFRMPGMDGVEVLSAVRKIDPGAPRILITGYPDLELAQRALSEARISKFFVKPLDPDELVEGVVAQLRERSDSDARRETLVRSLDAVSRRQSPPAFSLGRRPELR